MGLQSGMDPAFESVGFLANDIGSGGAAATAENEKRVPKPRGIRASAPAVESNSTAESIRSPPRGLHTHVEARPFKGVLAVGPSTVLRTGFSRLGPTEPGNFIPRWSRRQLATHQSTLSFAGMTGSLAAAECR